MLRRILIERICDARVVEAIGKSQSFEQISQNRCSEFIAYNERGKNLESIGVCDGMGGQGQYRLGRGSIGWARAVSAVPLPKSDFQHIKKVF